MLVAALGVAAAVLLAVAGVAKLRTPGPAATMVVTFWPRLRPIARGRRIARAAGVVELLTAAAVLAVGGRVAAALLLACYLVLAAVAVRLSGAHVSCGCFGAADGDVGVGHVVLDACGVAIGVAALVHPVGGVADLFHAGSLGGTTALVEAVLLAALGYLSITALPALSAARRSLEAAR